MFLIVGAFTRFVGVGLMVLSVLTISYFSYYAGPDLLKADGTYNGGYEYDVALGLLGLLFFVFGAGAVSVDRLFKRKKPVEDTDDDAAYLPSSSSSSAYGSSTAPVAHRPGLTHRMRTAPVQRPSNLHRIRHRQGTAAPGDPVTGWAA